VRSQSEKAGPLQGSIAAILIQIVALQSTSSAWSYVRAVDRISLLIFYPTGAMQDAELRMR
jgi:hypothetical protein